MLAARLCDVSPQSGASSATPCHSTGSFAEKLAQRHAEAFVGQIPVQAKRDQLLREPMDVRVPLDSGPIEPADLAVAAIGVIVAALRAPHFVAHHEHRRTDRKQGQREEVLDLSVAQPLHLGVVARPLDAAVPAPVIVRAVAVVFAVRLVVLDVVGDEVVQREPVVAGDEVDALLRLALLPRI